MSQQAFVIYNTKTWKIVNLPSGNTACYDSLTTTKRQYTKMLNNGIITKQTHAILEYNEYKNSIPNVEVRNCLTGVMVTIPADRAGTCSDPSMEAYHSM